MSTVLEKNHSSVILLKLNLELGSVKGLFCLLVDTIGLLTFSSLSYTSSVP